MVSLYDDPVLRRMASAPSSNKQNRSTTCILVVSVVIAFVVGALGSWFLHGAIFPSVEQNSSLPVPLGGIPSAGASSPGTNGQNVKPSKPTKTPGPSPSPPSPSPSSGGIAPKPKEERTLIADMLMSTDVIPEHYELLVKTYLPGYGAPISKEENLTFYGEVDITFKAHKSVDSIRLNSVNLEYDKEKSSVKTERGETIQVKSIKIDKKLEIATFTFEKAIPAGTFNFFITYTGLIADTLSGLYQTHYTENGVHKIAAVTQMEATMARQMVPCYDEPRHKASWGVTVIHPRGTRAISNGIEKAEAEVQGQFFMRTEFQKTPKMSSYLLAIMVSEFKFIEGYTKNKVRFRIWARPEAMETAKYALKTGIKCLESFEDFFGIKFPLAKQDMVALPDFAMGAMENWGLITYRETALLYDPKNYHYSNKIRVATVISHELAHQWFGNLVTMKWWDDIWLNEGFASFVENIGVDMVNDAAFEMMKDVIDDQLSTTLEVDSKASSNPIIFQVDYKEEIDDLFDPISYDKGGSLLAMINHLLGDRFNEGVTNYLKKYSYQNAEHGDLFREWDNVIPESMKGPNGERLNVTQFALRWTKQMGYPVLTLENAGSKARITQQRFKVDPEAKEREKFANPPYGFKWDVPVWIQKGDSDVELKWLPADGSLEIPVQKGEAVVLNADSYAIARMNYGKEGWENIIKQLKDDNTIYSDRTKYRIIADAFAMALTGRIPYEQAFSLSSYIIKEKAFLPWSALLGEIGKIKDFYGTSYQSKVVDGYKKRLLKPVFDKIDIQNVLEHIVDDASYTATKLPVLQYVSYCHVDPEACKEQIDAFYKDDFAIPCANNNKEASKCTSVPTALRSFVYCEAVKNGDYSTWETFFEKYKIETLQLERTKLMYALTCSQDPATLKILLSAMVNREKEGIIRLQDAGSIAIYIAENPVGAEIVFNYLLANWDAFQKEYSSQQSIINRIIKAFTSVIRTDYGLKQLKDFLAQESSTSKYFTFTTSMQAVQMKLDWVNKRGNDLLLFLKKAKV